MKKIITDIKNNIILKEEDIKNNKNGHNIINIYPNKIITTYLGMGAAITESVGYNYQKLSLLNQTKFIKDCYTNNGLNFNYGRISIGSNDFTIKSYEYSKKKDLSDFNINHDKLYVIPMIKDILKIKEISLIASPWSPPKMYKRLRLLRYGTKLKKKYYDKYVDYLIKFIDAYKLEGINIDYLTPQNEPMARQKWESCKFSLLEQKDFVYNYLVPKLKDTKVLLFDHNKDNIYYIFKELYQKNEKIAGLAFHYYSGSFFDNIKKIHMEYPNIILASTESCCGYSKYHEKSWIHDAEIILNDIIGDMNNGTNIYVYWNLLLDELGGPTYIKNYVKSLIILKNNNYLLTPLYYYIYHISHFVNNNSQIIYNECFTDELKVLSFKDKNKIIIIIMNISNKDYEYNLLINDQYYSDSINPHSIITYII